MLVWMDWLHFPDSSGTMKQ